MSKRKRFRTYLQLVVPNELRKEILESYHDNPLAGHLGIEKTFKRIQSKYWWPRCFIHVYHWIESCLICASKKNPQIRFKNELIPISVSEPFEIVGVDVVGPFPESTKGNKYLIVFTDHFTKWPEAFATPNQESLTIAKLLVEEILCTTWCSSKIAL